MRCFIAIDLPEEVKDRLARASRMLAPRFPDARWVRPESFHITLAFLGNVEGTELECARNAVQASAGSGAFNLAFSRTELLPQRGPRVLALMVGMGARECDAIHEKVTQVLAENARDPKLCPPYPSPRYPNSPSSPKLCPSYPCPPSKLCPPCPSPRYPNSPGSPKLCPPYPCPPYPCPPCPKGPDRRPYRAHVTLARAGRRPFPRAVSGVWEEIGSWMQAPCRVSRCILYRSDLEPGGARYEALLAVDL